MNKLIILLFVPVFFACSQKSEKIEVSFLDKESSFEFLFDDTDIEYYRDSVPVRVIIRRAVALKKSQTNNVPRDIMFSIDTLFGQTVNQGIGYAVLPYRNNKRVRIRNFEFKTNEPYEFDFKIIYNAMIPLKQKSRIINSSTKQDFNSEYDQNLYLLNEPKKNQNLINKIIPDSLKGYLAFNIVNKEIEHQFYQYKKIDF
ncbi:hypothetical protein [uncultured Aquimarina sp.]|uniref:hypothetical protein n=1 Tax=uncultured Aquimarina sp. TaxID=575652 RepID=UPI002634490F|nr:hypothetical protein [uncultured Aquimarina sp.]